MSILYVYPSLLAFAGVQAGVPLHDLTFVACADATDKSRREYADHIYVNIFVNVQRTCQLGQKKKRP